MIKAVAFDLDDTLISKRKYDYVCFKSVAEYLSKKFNLNFQEIYFSLLKEYDELNRAHPIDAVLKKYKIFSKKLLKKLIEVYRNTRTHSCLYKDTIPILKRAKKMGLLTILVSDGKIEAQNKKIKNTGIKKYFSKVIFTYSFGENRKKPDPAPFKQILNELKVKGKEMIYVGDNPYRDFVEVKKLGIHTMRIKRTDGQFRLTELPQEYEADQNIYQLDKIFDYIKKG